ncbi:cell division protein FtsZ [bacterium]|nr:cell division protein FtsZ [bacterium]
MPEFVLEDEPAGFARIKVVGVGGGGCNAVDSMFDLGLQNVEFFVINSDLQALKRSKCPNRIQIGAELTMGRGCGADPSLGERCMEDAREMMIETLTGADIVFVTAGLGGGTGTGAAPVIARIAKELGILTVTVVTRPFKFEGPRRTKSALEGLEKLRDASDTMIVINNERLLEVVGPKVPMKDAFATADKVLSQAVASISDLVTTPGLINVDFNDIHTIMGGRGGAVMGVGLGKGESRATEAVKKATNSPLLDKVVIDGATGVLICITGGPDMTLAEVSEATNLVAEAADPDAEIIFGAVIDESLEDSMRVTLIATGFSDELHRRRELEQAFKSAPTAPPSRLTKPDTPAPMAEMEEEISVEDELDDNPIFREESPKSRPRRVEPERPKQSSLREALESMMEEDGESEPERPRRAEQPPIRVARPRVNGGPAVRPANPQHASHEPRVKAQRHDEPAPSVPQYSPVGEEKAQEDDYDTPAFLRRRRSLFD